MTTIIISTSNFNRQAIEQLSKEGFTVVLNPHKRKLKEEEILVLIKENRPVALIAGVEPLTERVLSSSPLLRVISRCGTGLDNIDLDAAKRLDIKVYNTPYAPVEAVAELTLALMLNLLRKISEADRQLRRRHWQPLLGELLSCKTVGIIGFGRIGRRVADLVKAFGAMVISYDPYSLSDTHVELSFLLQQADIITLHLPYTKDKHHFINTERLSLMKRNCFLFNLSRGGLIDEEALYDALRTNVIAGAGLDVFEQEPYSGKLIECENVILTSHMGSYAKETRQCQEQEAIENLKLGLEGGR